MHSSAVFCRRLAVILMASSTDIPAARGSGVGSFGSFRVTCNRLLYGMYGHTYSKSMDQPGKAASPARGHLNRENEYSPVRVRALEFGLARRVRQSRPASACSSPYSGLIWCLLTGFLPSSAASIYSFITAIRHRVSPEFIGSRNCVPMAFTAKSPRHGASKPQGSSKRVLPWQVTMDQLIFASFSHTYYWYEVGMLKVPCTHKEKSERT